MMFMRCIGLFFTLQGLLQASPLQPRANTAHIRCGAVDPLIKYICPIKLGQQTFNLSADLGTDATLVVV
jgi:hypothetical protein